MVRLKARRQHHGANIDLLFLAQHIQVDGIHTTLGYTGVTFGADTTGKAALCLRHSFFQCVDGLHLVKAVQPLLNIDV